MTTVFDVSLQIMRHVTDVLESTATDGGNTFLTDRRHLTQENEYFQHGTLWLRSGDHAGQTVRVTGHASNRLTFEYLTPPLCVQQTITLTVSGAVTGDGDAVVLVQAAGMAGQSLGVAVTNGDDAAAVAGKIRTALNAHADLRVFFTIGGSGADITLTTKTATGNDESMLMTVDNWTCTGLDHVTSDTTTDGVAGPRYAVARKHYPWEQVRAKIEAALDETYVTGVDTSLEGDGTTLEFTLPEEVRDVKEIRFRRNGEDALRLSSHWRVTGTTLRFDYGYAPRAGDEMHVFHRMPHEPILSATTEIHREIDREWLALTAARELLFWGAGMYGAKTSEYLIEDRLNKVLGMLRGKTPRLDAPDLQMRTGG